MGWLTQSAFFASQHSIICATPEAYSVIALRRLRDFHTSIRQYHEIETLGLVLSFWDERGAINKEFLSEINNTFPDKLFASKIRRDISVSRAVLEGKPVFETDPNSRAANDYKSLVKKFLKKTEIATPKVRLKNLLKNKNQVEV